MNLWVTILICGAEPYLITLSHSNCAIYITKLFKYQERIILIFWYPWYLSALTVYHYFLKNNTLHLTIYIFYNTLHIVSSTRNSINNENIIKNTIIVDLMFKVSLQVKYHIFTTYLLDILSNTINTQRETHILIWNFLRLIDMLFWISNNAKKITSWFGIFWG